MAGDCGPPGVWGIAGVQFGLLSDRQLRQMSVCEVTHRDQEHLTKPAENTLYDPRMGPMHERDPNLCQTCNTSFTQCPGHFGHVNLVKPIFHPYFIESTVKILNCVCPGCSRLVFNPEDADDRHVLQHLESLPQSKRLAYAAEAAKKKRYMPKGNVKSRKCPFATRSSEEAIEDTTSASACDALLGCMQRGREGAIMLVRHFVSDSGANNVGTLFTPEMALKVLSGVSEHDARLLGFNPPFSHPSDHVMSAFPVPPPCMRPRVEEDSATASHDDLTVILIRVLDLNQSVKRQNEDSSDPEAIYRDDGNWTNLSNYLWNYINNGSTKLPLQQTSGSKRMLQGLHQRLNAKHGHVRNNIMGKRCNFTARTVITGDATISMDEIGVPLSVAKTLTCQEVVTERNRDKLSALIRPERGAEGSINTVASTYPSAVGVQKSGAPSYATTPIDAYHEGQDDLAIGDIVHRHLMNGDHIMFNRQPSLHKMSWMGFRVRVLPYSTFRLNLSCTTPFNADFDGDEMNMHVPQNPLAVAEIANVMLSPRQIISPQNNAPVMSVVQDSLLGSFLMTHRDVSFNKTEMMRFMTWINPERAASVPPPAILFPEPRWTGKQIYSLIIPTGVNLERSSSGRPRDEAGSRYASVSDTWVLIRNGELLCGILDKSTLGRGGGGLLHSVWSSGGPTAARDFLNEVQRIIRVFLYMRGFTIGYCDTIADQDTDADIRNEISQGVQSLTRSFEDACRGTIKREPGQTIKLSFESTVNKKLNDARENVGKKLMRHPSFRFNNIKNMVDSGSKGSTLNISQIVACVGQQNLEGARIPMLFQGTRTLPHYPAFAVEVPNARGFISNSYNVGLEPTEFFMHTMAGREGLSDTACKTADTGYIQRKLGKLLGELSVRYDRTVRDSDNSICQFLYGEDGFDAISMESQEFSTIDKSDTEVMKSFIAPVDTTDSLSYLSQEVRAHVEANRDTVKLKLEEEYDQLVADRNTLREAFTRDGVEKRWPVCVPVERIVQCRYNEIGVRSECNMSPEECVAIVRGIVGDIKEMSSHGSDPDRIRSQTTLLIAKIRIALCSKACCVRHRFSRDELKHIGEKITAGFIQALCSPGESVGIIAAQSISEPATQMTLNTFHFAGVSSKNVTLGVPRLDELLALTKTENMKTPRMVCYMSDEFASKIETKLDAKAKSVYTPVTGERYCMLHNLLKTEDTSLPANILTHERIDAVVRIVAGLPAPKYLDGEEVMASEGAYKSFAESLREPIKQLVNEWRDADGNWGGFSAGRAVNGLMQVIEPAITGSGAQSWLGADAALRDDVSQAHAKGLAASLEYTGLRSLIDYAEIVYDPDDEHSVVPSDRGFIRSYLAFASILDPPTATTTGRGRESSRHDSPFVIRLVLERSRLVDTELTMGDVAAALRNEELLEKARIITSTENDDELVCRIRLFAVSDDSVSNLRSLPETRKLLEELLALKTGEERTAIRGTRGIRSAIIDNSNFKRVKFLPDGSHKSINETVVLTDGISLTRVLHDPRIDPTRTTCNSVIEIYEVLGIEAARQALLDELRLVLAFDGTYINHRHLSLLVDMMSILGRLISVNRNGIDKFEGRALLKASFEQTSLQFANAGSMGILEPATSVVSSVFFGAPLPIGTGSFDVTINMDSMAPAVAPEAAEDDMAFGRTPAGTGYTPGTGFTPGLDTIGGTAGFDATAVENQALSAGGIENPMFSPVDTGAGSYAFDSAVSGFGFTPAGGVTPGMESMRLSAAQTPGVRGGFSMQQTSVGAGSSVWGSYLQGSEVASLRGSEVQTQGLSPTGYAAEEEEEDFSESPDV